MYSYGVSHVVLESLLGASPKVPEYYTSSGKFLALLFNQAKTGARQSIAFGIGLVAYHLGNRNECLRQNQDLL